jgi:DNA-binding response OmpR family regulator
MANKILIVDDEVHIRMLLEQTLEELEDDYGIEVFSSADGEEGFSVIREEHPGIVFLDIMMPRMNGYEICRSIKADPELRDIHIILLTAKGQEVDRQQGMDAGAYMYMTKPFDPDEVLELAKKLLGLE